MTNKGLTFPIDEALAALEAIPDLTVHKGQDLAPFTQIKSGGPADLLVMPKSKESLLALKALCLARDWPLTVLGRASNVLVSDEGIRGITVLLSPSLTGIKREGNQLLCAAGLPLYEIAAFAARQGLSGFEFACGIPGSLGGAIFMNAGAFEGSISQVVTRTVFLDSQGQLAQIHGPDHDFGYRHSYFSDKPDALIVEAELTLTPDQPQAVYDRMGVHAKKRYQSQPLAWASAGSAFRRPPGYFAGKLISEAGMKGYQRGQAGVSAKHAGFIVNHGGASSREILQIFLDVRQAVYDREGLVLMPEVRLIGDWGEDPFASQGLE